LTRVIDINTFIVLRIIYHHRDINTYSSLPISTLIPRFRSERKQNKQSDTKAGGASADEVLRILEHFRLQHTHTRKLTFIYKTPLPVGRMILAVAPARALSLTHRCKQNTRMAPFPLRPVMLASPSNACVGCISPPPRPRSLPIHSHSSDISIHQHLRAFLASA